MDATTARETLWLAIERYRQACAGVWPASTLDERTEVRADIDAALDAYAATRVAEERAQLRALLAPVVALREQATPGPWEGEREYLQNGTLTGAAIYAGRVLVATIHDAPYENSELIAAFHGLIPALAALLAEGAEEAR